MNDIGFDFSLVLILGVMVIALLLFAFTRGK